MPCSAPTVKVAPAGRGHCASGRLPLIAAAIRGWNSRARVPIIRPGPLLRLCTYWFVMTAALGVYFPFFSGYLEQTLAFRGVQIGALFAVPPLVSLIAQPFWSYVADRTGSRARVLTLLSFGTASGYALLTLPRSFFPMMCAVTWLSFFSSAQMSMAVAVSLTLIARDAKHVPFGHVRVWGTLGFFLTVLGVPPLVRQLAVHAGTSEPAQFHLVFALAGALATCASTIALGMPTAPEHAR